MSRALRSIALLVVVALTAGCSAVQVRTWFRVVAGRDISTAEATEIARNLNRQIRPGCDENYVGGCVPNNAVDVDCLGFGDGPVFVRGPLLVPGWDHYGLDPDRDKVACENPPPPPPPPPKPTTTTSSTTTTTTTTTVPPMDAFDIVLRTVGTLDPAVETTFREAADFWESAISAGIPDAAITPDPVDPRCLPDAELPPAVVDDLVIDVEVTELDGSGGVLGLAGPCYVANPPGAPVPGDGLTRVGAMQFDSADVAARIASGTFDDLVRHEIGHVLGFGSLWPDFGVIDADDPSDPRYTGSAAVSRYALLGGVGTVPVEAEGGDATALGHWRESVFGNELMTGFIGSDNPLSAMSIASLADLGYQVDPSVADEYSLPPPLLRALRSPVRDDAGEMLRPPIRRVG